MSCMFKTQGGGGGGFWPSIFVTGLSESDTVTATKDEKTVQGKWGKSNPAYLGLPDGYTQVEYIEGSGTQYLKIPLNVSDYSTMEFEVESTWPAVATEGGSVDGNGTPSCFHVGLFTDSNLIQYGNGSADATTNFEVADRNGWHKYKNSLKDGKIYFDGNVVHSYTPVVSGMTANAYMGIFTWLNQDGSLNQFSALQSSKKSRVRIWYDGVLQNDLVSARNDADGSFGVYDLVTGAFHKNAGTGEFIAGEEVLSVAEGFLISPLRTLGMWTVTATSGEKATTYNVLVDAAVEFPLVIPSIDETYLARSANTLIATIGNRTWRKPLDGVAAACIWSFGAYHLPMLVSKTADGATIRNTYSNKNWVPDATVTHAGNQYYVSTLEEGMNSSAITAGYPYIGDFSDEAIEAERVKCAIELIELSGLWRA